MTPLLRKKKIVIKDPAAVTHFRPHQFLSDLLLKFLENHSRLHKLLGPLVKLFNVIHIIFHHFKTYIHV